MRSTRNDDRAMAFGLCGLRVENRPFRSSGNRGGRTLGFHPLLRCMWEITQIMSKPLKSFRASSGRRSTNDEEKRTTSEIKRNQTWRASRQQDIRAVSLKRGSHLAEVRARPEGLLKRDEWHRSAPHIPASPEQVLRQASGHYSYEGTRTPFSGTQLTIAMSLEKNKLALLRCPSCNRGSDLRLPWGPKSVPKAKMRRQARRPVGVKRYLASGTRNIQHKKLGWVM